MLVLSSSTVLQTLNQPGVYAKVPINEVLKAIQIIDKKYSNPEEKLFFIKSLFSKINTEGLNLRRANVSLENGSIIARIFGQESAEVPKNAGINIKPSVEGWRIKIPLNNEGNSEKKSDGAVLEGPRNRHVVDFSNLTLTLSSIESSISSAPRDEAQNNPASTENGTGTKQGIAEPKPEQRSDQLVKQKDSSLNPKIDVTSKVPPHVFSTAKDALDKLSQKISTDPAMKDPKRIITSSEFLAAKNALIAAMKDAKNLTEEQRKVLLETIMSLQAILVAGGSEENLFALIKKDIDPTENDSISKIIDWMTCDATSTSLTDIQDKYLASKTEIDRLDPAHTRLTALLLTKAKKQWDIKKTNNDINGALAVYETMIANISLPMNTRIFLNQSLAQQLIAIKQPDLARAVLGRLTGYQVGITNYNAWSDATSFWNFGTTRITLQNISLKSETSASDVSKRILYKAFQDQIACFDAKKMTTTQWNNFVKNVSGSSLSLDHKQSLYIEAMQKKLLNGESNEATFSALRNLAINPRTSVKNQYRVAFVLAEYAKNAGNRPLMESWLSFAVSCVNKFAPSEKNAAKFETSVRLIQQFEWTTKGTDMLNELLTIPKFKQQVLKIPELKGLIGNNLRFDPTKVSDSKRFGRALEKALDVSGQSSLAAQAAAVGIGTAIGAGIGVWAFGAGAIPGAFIGGIVGDLSLRAYNVITNASAISDIYQSGYDGISDFQTLMNGAGLLSSVLGLSKGVGLASKGMKFLRLADTCLTVGLMGTPQAISLYQYSQGQITGEQWRDGLVTQLETFAVMFAAGAIGAKIGEKGSSHLKFQIEKSKQPIKAEPATTPKKPSEKPEPVIPEKPVVAQTTPPDPVAKQNQPNRGNSSISPIEQSKKFLETGLIEYGQEISDGYRDGGQSSKINDLENHRFEVISGREIILVDRSTDSVLAKSIEYIKKATRNLDEVDKMKFINQYVLDKMGGIGTEESVNRTENFTNKFENTDMTLGTLIEHGLGVCRHRALLFKILSDTVGLKVSLKRGYYADISEAISSERGFNHAWNIVQIKGKTYLVDTMHGKLMPEGEYREGKGGFYASQKSIKQAQAHGERNPLLNTGYGYSPAVGTP